MEEIICDQLVVGINNNMRKTLLVDTNLNLYKAIELSSIEEQVQRVVDETRPNKKKTSR